VQPGRVREVHRRALFVQPIDDPIPAVGRFDHHLRLRAGIRDRPGQREGIIRDAHRPELLARRVLPDDHRTSTMKVNPDILSIQMGLPSSEEDTVVKSPESRPRARNLHKERRPRSFIASAMARLLPGSTAAEEQCRLVHEAKSIAGWIEAVEGSLAPRTHLDG